MEYSSNIGKMRNQKTSLVLLIVVAARICRERPVEPTTYISHCEMSFFYF
jgi:hypothetical protein